MQCETAQAVHLQVAGEDSIRFLRGGGTIDGDPDRRAGAMLTILSKRARMDTGLSIFMQAVTGITTSTSIMLIGMSLCRNLARQRRAPSRRPIIPRLPYTIEGTNVIRWRGGACRRRHTNTMQLRGCKATGKKGCGGQPAGGKICEAAAPLVDASEATAVAWGCRATNRPR